MKKIKIFMLFFTIVLSLFCITMVANASGLSLKELQAKFPNKAYWNHTTTPGHGYSGTWATGPCNNPDGVTWQRCYSHSANAPVGYSDCNSFNGAMQCCGFARKVAYDAYGEYCYNWKTTNSLSNVKAGDVIHYTGGNADPTYGHWVFVTGVSGNVLSVGQCNLPPELCQIRWDLTIDKNNIGPATVYIAPYSLNEIKGKKECKHKYDDKGNCTLCKEPFEIKLNMITPATTYKAVKDGVPVRNNPYAPYDIINRLSKNTLVTVIASGTNSKGNLWYKLDDGTWVFSENLQKITTQIILKIGSTTASVNGKSIYNDVAPALRNSRTMLPIRFVAENLGANVSWNSKTETVIITGDGIDIKIPVGSKKATVNGKSKELDSPAYEENGRTFVPVRFISEALGAVVTWYSNTQTVDIVK